MFSELKARDMYGIDRNEELSDLVDLSHLQLLEGLQTFQYIDLIGLC